MTDYIKVLEDFPFSKHRGIVLVYFPSKNWGYIGSGEIDTLLFLNEESLIHQDGIYFTAEKLNPGTKVRFDVLGKGIRARATRVVASPEQERDCIRGDLSGTVKTYKRGKLSRDSEGIIEEAITKNRARFTNFNFEHSLRYAEIPPDTRVKYDEVRTGSIAWAHNIRVM